MKLRFPLLAMAVAAVVLMLLTAGTSAAPEPRADGVSVLPAVPATSRVAGVVHCKHPLTLRLVRFEDGSAQLRCGRRILIRVSVPG